MAVLVDTSVWSLALRRSTKHLNPAQAAIVADLQELLRDGQARLVGAIRQELLTGIREQRQFESLRDYLRAIPDTELGERDYENAAAAANRCLAFGIAILLGIEAFVNIAVVTGLLPTKGLALPFISYGGSSLIITMFAVGVLLNVSSRMRGEP